jgi:hypothetical protein
MNSDKTQTASTDVPEIIMNSIDTTHQGLERIIRTGQLLARVWRGLRARLAIEQPSPNHSIASQQG